MTNTRGQHCIYKENRSFLEKKKEEEYLLQQDKGALWFIKGSLILSASDTKCFWQWKGEQ